MLHLDFWRERGTELYFGWLPEEFAWRVGWMHLAFGYLAWFYSSVWTEEEGYSHA